MDFIDLSALRIPLSVGVAVLSLILLFVLTSKVVKFVLMVIFVVAIILVGWWALQYYGVL